MLRNGFFSNFSDKDRKCKIYWIHGSMTEEEIHGLYVHPKIDSYITTTHGEGLGFPCLRQLIMGCQCVLLIGLDILIF